MANRIGARLARWVRLPDSDLSKELFALGEHNRPADAASARGSCSPRCSMPRRAADPDHPQLRPDAARGFPGRSRDRARLPADRGPGRAGTGAAHARRTAGGRRGAAATTALIARRPVPQPAARRGGRGRISPGLRAAARRAGGTRRARRDRAAIRAADGAARGVGRGLYRRTIAATTASIATCCARSPTPTADGARRPGLGYAETIEDWLALTPIERAAALPRAAQGRAHRKGHAAQVSAGQPKAEPHYDRHAGRLAVLIGELLAIQNGAQACRRHGGGTARRPGVRRGLHAGPSAPPASPISTT